MNDIKIADSRSLQEILTQNKIVAINLAGWYGEELEQAKQNNQLFVTTDTVPARLNMLDLGRVDVVIDDQLVLCSNLGQLGSERLAVHPLKLSEASIHYIFNKNTISAQFVQHFNEALNEVKSTGQLEQVLSSGLTDTCKRSPLDSARN